MPVIPFAPWRPDVAELNAAYTGDVLNVLCADGSYIPFPQLQDFTAALPDDALGAFVARSLAGSVVIFAGTEEKLYRLDNTDLGWDDVSQATVTYGATPTAPWSFAQFGDYVVAVNQNDDPQVFNLGSSTKFADLAGSPPRAGVVRAWGDFLVLMQLTSNLNRAQWSGLNDIEEWTPGTANSDYQDFPDGGVVQGSTQATNPIIFLERAIWLGTFIPGSVEIFSFQKIHENRGARSANSIATRGAFAFYADEGGFFQISPSGEISSIGFEQVDRTMFGSISAAEVGRIAGAVDPFFSRVYWAVNQSAAEGLFDTIIVYDWTLQRWSQANATIRFHFPASAPSMTLEGLDSISTSLDALPFSLDSKAYQSSAPVLAAFNEANVMGMFSGAPMEALLTTSEAGDVQGGVTLVKSVTPIVDATDLADLSVAIGSRLRRSDSLTWTSEQVPSSNTGIVRKKSRGRFNRIRLRIAEDATWNHAQGVAVDAMPMGRR